MRSVPVRRAGIRCLAVTSALVVAYLIAAPYLWSTRDFRDQGPLSLHTRR